MTNINESSQIDYASNTFRILIATDNHIGYLEDDPIRGKDSLNTFEEILKMAKQQQVDFILLGGDLFHHNRPSRSCIYQTMRLLRKYCMGDKPSEIWISSDQSAHFPDDFATANYLDPNYNISYPVFCIHGNHDDPSGAGNLCSLQLLSTSGLMNYFGRVQDIQQVNIQPILMEKGTSKLALYGLGNIRDERLHRTWRDGRVNFDRPIESDWRDEAFNLFVIHQNRVKHGPTSYIPEMFLDDFLDLVLWGHEHDCRIDPESNGVPDGPSIIQPGSSVATSLTDGEALTKYVGLLEINGRDYELKKLRLTTVRPFQCTTVVLHQQTDFLPSDTKACQQYLHNVVMDLIEKAKEIWKDQLLERRRQQSEFSQMMCQHSNEEEGEGIEVEEEDDAMPLPLIRIRVDYTDAYDVFNPLQFGQQYINQVANPKDIIKFRRIKDQANSNTSAGRRARTRAVDIIDDTNTSARERLDQIKVEDLVNDLLERDLSILPENELMNSVKMFVDKDDKSAIKRFVNSSISRIQQCIPPTMDFDILTEEYVNRRVSTLKNERSLHFARDHAGLLTQTSQVDDDDNNSNNNQMGDTNSIASHSAQREREHTTEEDIELFSDILINNNNYKYEHDEGDAGSIRMNMNTKKMTNKKKNIATATRNIPRRKTKATASESKTHTVDINSEDEDENDSDEDEDGDGLYCDKNDNDFEDDEVPTATFSTTTRKRLPIASTPTSSRAKRSKQDTTVVTTSQNKGKKRATPSSKEHDARATLLHHNNKERTQSGRESTDHNNNQQMIMIDNSSEDEDASLFNQSTLPISTTQSRRILPASLSQHRKN
ncbi:Metallo-dependent phosphatase-like protein [Cunninghamella echinulata]|nr:Metallo-dependent phosphatase-like protein [Cunninghamella echinulata]